MERGKQEQKLPFHQLQSGAQSPLHVGSFNQLSLPPLVSPFPSNPPPLPPPLPPLLESPNGVALQIPFSSVSPQTFSLSTTSQTRCTACGLGFPEKEQLVAHLKLHLPGFPSPPLLGPAGPPFVCPTCSLSFPKTEDLATHMITHSPGNGIVGIPPLSPSSLALSPSDSLKENGSPFLGNRFKGNLLPKTPKGIGGEKPFVCDKCNKAFSQKGNLSTHIRDTHTNPSGVACPVCGKKLKNKNSLKVHIRTHSENLPFICTADDCGRRFNQKCSLVIHQRIHTGEKPYTCSCGKKFRSSSNCAAHKRSHTGEGCIPCNVCGKKFGSRSRYISHSRTHTGEKPFQCQVCDKRFTEKSSRSKHMRIHSREKPFGCPYCEKKFRLKRGLNSHLRTHTNDMPFACNMCGRTYRHKVSLTKHAVKCDEKSSEQREREREQNLVSSPGNPPSPMSPTESPVSLAPLSNVSELSLVQNGVPPIQPPVIGSLAPSRIHQLSPLPNRSPIGPMGLPPSNGTASGAPGRVNPLNPLLAGPPMIGNGSNGTMGLGPGLLCAECGLSFKTSAALQIHKRNAHDTGGPILTPGMSPYPPVSVPPTSHIGLSLSPRFSLPEREVQASMFNPSYGSMSGKRQRNDDPQSSDNILRMGGVLSLPPSPSGSLSTGPFEPPLKLQRTDLHRLPILPTSDLMPEHHSSPLNHNLSLQELEQDPEEAEDMDQELEPDDHDNSPSEDPDPDLNQSISVS